MAVCYHCERCRRMPQENGKRAGFGLSVCESHALGKFMHILQYTLEYMGHGRPKVHMLMHHLMHKMMEDVGLVIQYLFVRSRYKKHRKIRH